MHKIVMTRIMKEYEHTHHHQEPEIDMDSAVTGGVSEISMRHIEFGDLFLVCPNCQEEADSVLIGLGTSEDQESDGPTSELTTVGVVMYPCSDTFVSDCLTEKIAKILNAEEYGVLRPSMFVGLLNCPEHGVEFSEDQ